MRALNVLVTGHSGFIGKAVSSELTARKHWVRLFSGDVRNTEDVDRQVRACQLVIHLAGKTPGYGYSGLSFFASHNTEGSITVAEACAKFDVPLAFAATRLSEGPYGQSKAMAEYVLKREFGATPIRISMAYGPGQPAPEPWGSGPRRLIPQWICSALTGGNIVITGNPETVPDLVYIDDVADQVADVVDRVAQGRRLPAELELAGPGKLSLSAVAQKVAAVVYRQLRLEPPIVLERNDSPDPPDGQPGTGTPLHVGLRNTVTYYRAFLDR